MKRLKGLIPCCILELKNSETTGIFYPHWDRFFEVVLQNKNKMRARACSSVLQWFRQRHLPNRTRRFPIPNAMLHFGWLCANTIVSVTHRAARITRPPQDSRPVWLHVLGGSTSYLHSTGNSWRATWVKVRFDYSPLLPTRGLLYLELYLSPAHR